MTRPSLAWIGLAGVDAADGPRAHAWEERLHWVMVGIALLAIPAYVLDSTEHAAFAWLAEIIDVVILVAFLGESVWMAHVSRRPVHYLVANWLNLVIIAGSAASVMGSNTSTEALAVVRVLRVAVVGLLAARALGGTRVLFTRRGAPLLVGTAVLALLVEGAMFYWLEPSITTYWDGLWLAFVTATTIGYGDFVATTGASRMLSAVTALLGVSLMALFTANLVSVFVDAEDKQLRREMHHDIADLRNRIAQLLDREELVLQDKLSADIGELTRQLAIVLDAEHEDSRRQLRRELAEVRREIAALREELRALAETRS